jgi:hypothetical protein
LHAVAKAAFMAVKVCGPSTSRRAERREHIKVAPDRLRAAFGLEPFQVALLHMGRDGTLCPDDGDARAGLALGRRLRFAGVRGQGGAGRGQCRRAGRDGKVDRAAAFCLAEFVQPAPHAAAGGGVKSGSARHR